MKKNYFKFLIVFGSIGIGLFFYVHNAYAFDVASFFKNGIVDGITWFFSGIAFIFGWLAGVVINLENYLLEWVLNVNFYLMDSLILKRGWEIVRDIANLGFALGILIISIATIVNYQEYHAKRLLARLIIAALLINFSLMICGVFVDFSGSFMKYFANSWGGPEKLGTMLQTAVNAPKIHQGPSEEALKNWKDEAKKSFGIILGSFGGVVFSAVFSVILMIVYGAMICLFLVRYGALLFLMILSPLAWIFLFLPGVGGEEPGGIWRKWWSSFLKWIFFGPVMLFFVFLALLVLDPNIGGKTSETKLAESINKKAREDTVLGLTALAKESSPQTGLSWLIQYSVVIVILVGGMKIALDASGYGGRGFYDAAEKVAKYPGVIAKRIGVRALKRYGSPMAERAAMLGAGKETKTGRTLSWVATKVPGVKYLTKGGIKAGHKMRGEIFEKADKLKSFSVKALERYLEAGTPEEKAASLISLIKHKGVWKPSYDKYRNVLKRFGINEGMISSRIFLEDSDLKSLAQKIEKAKGRKEEIPLKEELQTILGRKFSRMTPSVAKQQFWSNIIKFEDDFKKENPALSHIYEAFYKNLPYMSGPVFAEVVKPLPAKAVAKIERKLEENLKAVGGEKPDQYGAWLSRENPSLETYLRSQSAQNLGMRIELPKEIKKGSKEKESKRGERKVIPSSEVGEEEFEKLKKEKYKGK